MKAKPLTIAAAAVVAFCVSLFVLSGCGQTRSDRPRVKIVATTFPVYDWTREVLGDRLSETDLVLLQQSGADLHSYSPSAADLRQIAACGLFVFVGGESDEWTERALAQKGNPRRRVLNLGKNVECKMENGECEAAVDSGSARHNGHGHEMDEHVWLSLRNAAIFVKAIASELGAIDPENANTCHANADAYCAKLVALDGEYTKVVSGAKRRTLLVADRFPFRYLADDYGLEHFAAFAGCSAESEASFKTIAFLAQKVDELKLPVIVTTEGADHKIAETVRRTTQAKDQRILALDSLQSIGGEAAKTTHYLDVMRRNLETLKAILN